MDPLALDVDSTVQAPSPALGTWIHGWLVHRPPLCTKSLAFAKSSGENNMNVHGIYQELRE